MVIIIFFLKWPGHFMEAMLRSYK